MTIKEPTGDECTENAKVYEDENSIGYAVWYPQMGGYVGNAVAVFCKQWEDHESGCRVGGCIEVYVWHDGDFPFSEDDGSGRKPAHLHHCDAEQFIHFGQTLERLNNQGRIEVKPNNSGHLRTTAGGT